MWELDRSRVLSGTDDARVAKWGFSAGKAVPRMEKKKTSVKKCSAYWLGTVRFRSPVRLRPQLVRLMIRFDGLYINGVEVKG